MLQVLEGTKLCYFNNEVSVSRTLATPEFDRTVLWDKVKDDTDFLKYIPDNLLAKSPDRIPK